MEHPFQMTQSRAAVPQFLAKTGQRKFSRIQFKISYSIHEPSPSWWWLFQVAGYSTLLVFYITSIWYVFGGEIV